jgi:hypothetical protein
LFDDHVERTILAPSLKARKTFRLVPCLSERRGENHALIVGPAEKNIHSPDRRCTEDYRH